MASLHAFMRLAVVLHLSRSVLSCSGVQGGGARTQQPRKMGRDPNEKPKNLTDMLPDWVGYSAVYAVSLIPIFIGAAVIAILFFNSLR